MHRLLLVVAASAALAACSHSKASGPKWPEPAVTDEDGGESLAPHPSATYAAAVEKSADGDDDKPAAETTAAPAAAPTGDGPATSAPAATQQPTEDVFTTEEIIIEIDD